MLGCFVHEHGLDSSCEREAVRKVPVASVRRFVRCSVDVFSTRVAYYQVSAGARVWNGNIFGAGARRHTFEELSEYTSTSTVQNLSTLIHTVR